MGQRSVRRQRARLHPGAGQSYGVAFCLRRFRAIRRQLAVARPSSRMRRSGGRKAFWRKAAKAHFKQQRAFRRYCGALALGSPLPLSRIAFEETEKGRPYLPELPGVLV